LAQGKGVDVGNGTSVSNNVGVALTSGKRLGVGLVSNGVAGGLETGVGTEMTGVTVSSGASTTVWPCRA
jgi:hypothetical protein